jgi:hypothetical protein
MSLPRIHLTRSLLRSWHACWPEVKIAARVPVKGLHVTVLDACDAEGLCVSDRIWLACHLLPEREARLLGIESDACHGMGAHRFVEGSVDLRAVRLRAGH